MSTQLELQQTIKDMAVPGKGILAADESTATIQKRFADINLESTELNRATYRTLLLSTPGAADFLSGVILFEETLGQTSVIDGTPIPALAASQGIVPGIKVDQGLTDLVGCPGEQVTRGLEGLPERLAGYKAMGARFAKWRNVYHIGQDMPSRKAIDINAKNLAEYAAMCQQQGIVPIVEPEVLIDGTHTIERAAEVTQAAIHALYEALYDAGVELEYTILKPNMVVPGKGSGLTATPQQVAEMTVKTLKRTVPAAVPMIAFLSGGLSPAESDAFLSAINEIENKPWLLTFSYGRALQQEVLQAWDGDSENWESAQDVFHHRVKLTGAAQLGEYSAVMER